MEPVERRDPNMSADARGQRILKIYLIFCVISLVVSSVIFQILNGPALMSIVIWFVAYNSFSRREWVVFVFAFAISIVAVILSYTTYPV